MNVDVRDYASHQILPRSDGDMEYIQRTHVLWDLC